MLHRPEKDEVGLEKRKNYNPGSREEFLISSHHPLWEKIMQQTGTIETARKDFLIMLDKRVIDALIHRWSTTKKDIGNLLR